MTTEVTESAEFTTPEPHATAPDTRQVSGPAQPPLGSHGNHEHWLAPQSSHGLGPSGRRPRLVSAVWLVRVMLLGWLALSFFVQNDIGLADNGDYTRFMAAITSGPVGLANFPAAGTPEWERRFFNDWLPYWHLDWPLQWPATSVVLLWLPGAALNAALYSRDILWMPLVGLPIKLALLGLVALLFGWIDRRAPRHRLGLSVVLAGPLVLMLSTTDFVAYINTFYREAGAAVFLLLFLATVLYLSARPTSWGRWWLCLAAGVLLTLAKTSNTYWPLLWVPLLMAFTLRRRSWRAWLGRGVVGAALIAWLMAGSLVLQSDKNNADTSYDNFFNSALLLSRHPAEHLARLGMPEALPCVGVSAFLGIGVDCFARYIGRMRPSNTLSVLLHEPMVALYQFQLGLENLGDESLEYQGLYAQTDPRAQSGPTVTGPYDERFWGPRSNLLLNGWSWLRFHLFPHGWPALIFLAVVAGLASLGLRQAGAGRDLALVSLIAVAACLVDLQVQVVGEGTQDLVRHLFLSNILFDLAWIAALGSLVCGRRPRGGAQRCTVEVVEVHP